MATESKESQTSQQAGGGEPTGGTPAVQQVQKTIPTARPTIAPLSQLVGTEKPGEELRKYGLGMQKKLGSGEPENQIEEIEPTVPTTTAPKQAAPSTEGDGNDPDTPPAKPAAEPTGEEEEPPASKPPAEAEPAAKPAPDDASDSEEEDPDPAAKEAPGAKEPAPKIKVGDKEYTEEEIQALLNGRQEPNAPEELVRQQPQELTPEQIEQQKQAIREQETKFITDQLDQLDLSTMGIEFNEELYEKMLNGGQEGLDTFLDTMKRFQLHSLLMARKAAHHDLQPKLQELEHQLTPIARAEQQRHYEASVGRFKENFDHLEPFMGLAEQIANGIRNQYGDWARSVDEQTFFSEVAKQTEAHLDKWNVPYQKSGAPLEAKPAPQAKEPAPKSPAEPAKPSAPRPPVPASNSPSAGAAPAGGKVQDPKVASVINRR